MLSEHALVALLLATEAADEKFASLLTCFVVLSGTITVFHYQIIFYPPLQVALPSTNMGLLGTIQLQP